MKSSMRKKNKMRDEKNYIFFCCNNYSKQQHILGEEGGGWYDYKIKIHKRKMFNHYTREIYFWKIFTYFLLFFFFFVIYSFNNNIFFHWIHLHLSFLSQIVILSFVCILLFWYFVFYCLYYILLNFK